MRTLRTRSSGAIELSVSPGEIAFSTGDPTEMTGAQVKLASSPSTTVRSAGVSTRNCASVVRKGKELKAEILKDKHTLYEWPHMFVVCFVLQTFLAQIEVSDVLENICNSCQVCMDKDFYSMDTT